ncbi:hypothetical protein DFH08DRAFT_1073294 [Mycena albidolilacea]|uniref:Uncharacterized protein n=1 Tax=Mycena albidolilacea TaxID=1033008 RepID=A0AAD7AQ64_9AGAR|nr:hypothetical protein DFH08DRAFT_1073294 [Mycena albidolilacea]
MSLLLSLSSAAGPSSTTLQALSEYCASADSPSDPLFSDSESSYSFISEFTPAPPPNAIPQLVKIIAQSPRFQSASVQNKMLTALRGSTRSGFTRPAPSRSSRRNRAVSTQAIYEGLPQSPSDHFFNDASLLETSTPLHIGLGLLVPSSSTSSDMRLLSPLASRSLSPTRGGGDALVDRLPSRLLLSSPNQKSRTPHATPSHRTPPPPPSNDRLPTSRYTDLGLGLPSNMKDDTAANNRLQTGFTISSISRVWSMIPSGSYTRELFNGLPELTRCSRFEPAVTPEPKIGPLARLREGATSFVRERLRRVSVSAVHVTRTGGPLFRAEFVARAIRGAQDEGSMVKRTLGSVARFLARR